jgi:hypothetical protein
MVAESDSIKRRALDHRISNDPQEEFGENKTFVTEIFTNFYFSIAGLYSRNNTNGTEQLQSQNDW